MKPPKYVARFWQKVDTSGDCWEWIAAIDSKGYGVFQARERSSSIIRAHRLSWELAHGSIPDGMFVCHACDNRKCVRPDHLFLGTNKDNMQDMARKGRHNFGERVPNASLTEVQATRIIQLHLMSLTQPEIARMVGTTHQTVGFVLSGRTWRHLTPSVLPQKGRMGRHYRNSPPSYRMYVLGEMLDIDPENAA